MELGGSRSWTDCLAAELFSTIRSLPIHCLCDWSAQLLKEQVVEYTSRWLTSIVLVVLFGLFGSELVWDELLKCTPAPSHPTFTHLSALRSRPYAVFVDFN